MRYNKSRKLGIKHRTIGLRWSMLHGLFILAEVPVSAPDMTQVWVCLEQNHLFPIKKISLCFTLPIYENYCKIIGSYYLRCQYSKILLYHCIEYDLSWINITFININLMFYQSNNDPHTPIPIYFLDPFLYESACCKNLVFDVSDP